MEEKIALILPVLNCLDYTKQFLNTLMGKASLKMVLINNGSTDGTEEYFNSLKLRPKVCSSVKSWHYNDDGRAYRVWGEVKQWRAF